MTAEGGVKACHVIALRAGRAVSDGQPRGGALVSDSLGGRASCGYLDPLK